VEFSLEILSPLRRLRLASRCVKWAPAPSPSRGHVSPGALRKVWGAGSTCSGDVVPITPFPPRKWSSLIALTGTKEKAARRRLHNVGRIWNPALKAAIGDDLAPRLPHHGNRRRIVFWSPVSHRRSP